MPGTRRELLVAGATALAGAVLPKHAGAAPDRPRMGLVIHSHGVRQASEKPRGINDPLAFLDLCRSFGAGGAQTPLGTRDDAYADKVRAFIEEHKLFLEASITLPRDTADVERFREEVRTARRCGVSLFRTVLMSGRRYELFDSADAFRHFHEQGRQALARARPVVEQHEMKMAVENHKDLQATGLVEMIKTLDSPLIGVCLDLGNNMALLEQPARTVELLAPLALTTHVKDMGVEEYKDGFLLSEVPLGTGLLDLPALVGSIRRIHPSIRLNLEMITRDPLRIPCLTPKYWATLDDVPGRTLAEMLALVRARPAKPPLPRISVLSKSEQIAREDEHVRKCLEYAREKLDA
jgi:3-oxoisoapionate decarboxylase